MTYLRIAILTSAAAFIGTSGSSTAAAQVPTLRERANPYLESARAVGEPFVTVSAASGMPNVAAGSLAIAFGSNLATRTEQGTAPYPTSLGGISVQVLDNNGVSRQAQLLYVSPTQINYLVPADTTKGSATVKIVNPSGSFLNGTAMIQTVAPALFTANGNGTGVVAATASRRVIPTNITSPVPVFQCDDKLGSCVSVPINPGVDAPVTITFYATGLRGRSSDSAVTLTMGGQALPVRTISQLADTDPSAGVDLVVVDLPFSLRGSGEIDVVLAVDGATSNTGRINIQ